ncbi:tubulin polyglutamylase TTLL13-like isoform X2 [Cataglyphis hispanica]|uniref:tubulin polyglutamylase TTLL13-like isoform X2 n=1 Tax=Cataglyphis hispanica TaxID=1086592 RepID=UPI00218045F7|nr:tubulin polyglutamylase TTLL13-like isoform X2 [Cataglyphis hispanica]
MIIELSDKYSLMISRDSRNDNSGNADVTEGVELNNGFEERFCKSVFKDRKDLPDHSPNVFSLTNDRIGVTKHDSELYHWKITTGKDNNREALHEKNNSERRTENVEETSKIKKKRRFLTICTASCKYNVVRRVAARFGMREVTEDSSWDLYWTDLSVSVERAKDMKRFQRINHFPGMTEICRKDLLARNLNRMQKLFPKDYNFFPKTWCFPAEFATSKYKEPTGQNISNMFMHLTNYSVNKHSRMYVIDDEIGSKRKISTFNKWLRAKNIDVDDLWDKIDGIIIKTLVATYPVLKHNYHACFPMHDKTYACFELLGFDILLDWRLKPFLLEVNHSPSFHTDAQIDRDVKEGLLMDTFDILNLQQFDKKKIIEEDKKRIRERLLQGINGKDFSQTNDTTASTKSVKNENDYLQRQFQWEDDHMGNFRRIYPCLNEDKYQSFFSQNPLSVFQDTVASRAREEASRIEREENELKAKEEERKRIVRKWSEQKLGSESSTAIKKFQEKSKSAGVLPRKNIIKQDAQGSPTNTLYSFEPEIISESEERERITALAQRDFLIKSYGMLEQIYMAMKKNGTLRPADEKKYGLYGRFEQHANTNDNMCSSAQHRRHHHQNNSACSTQQTTDQCIQCSLKGNNQKMEEREFNNSNKTLWITCNEALVYVRPKIPQKLWMMDMSTNKSRVTKGQLARTLSNTVRVHTLKKREAAYSSKL